MAESTFQGPARTLPGRILDMSLLGQPTQMYLGICPNLQASSWEALSDVTHFDPNYANMSSSTCIISFRHDFISALRVVFGLRTEISKGRSPPELVSLNSEHIQVLEDVFGVSQAIHCFLSFGLLLQ